VGGTLLPDTICTYGGTNVLVNYLPSEIHAPLVQLAEALGLDMEDPEYAKTPRRATEWFWSFARKPDYENDAEDFFSVTFPSAHEEMVWETGLSFVALCPHHLLPYSGTASIAYIPSGHVVGISKLARALEYYTHYPVKQEDATANLANAIMQYLQPLGCMVVLRAFHACMGLRGVKQPAHQTGTSAVRGCFANDKDGCRSEFLRLATAP
jgi:GTP cyclohydrolase I